MGPKKKGKGGKKEKVKKEEPPRPTKSQYLARIAEMNAVLAQIRRETYDIEGLYFESEKKYQQVQEDLVDIIKYLEHEIAVCEEEIAGYDLGIDKYTTEMNEQDNYYKEIFARKEEEYEIKQTQLTEKLQSVSAKLNSFEEVRRQREEFIRKQEALKTMMEEMTLRHKNEIYEAEKQAIIQQDKLQKEMEKRLTQLSIDFREATDMRIGETTNRIINENIKLGNILTCKQELLNKIRTQYNNMKQILNHATLDVELKEGEYNLTYKKYKAHAEQIEELLQTVDALTKRIEELKELVKTNRRLKRKILELECYLRDLTQEQNTLSKSLEAMEELTLVARGNLRNFQKNIFKLMTSLFDAAKLVKEAIDCENAVLPEGGAATESQESIPKVEDTKAIEDAEKETLYKKRETLIEEIMIKLQTGNLSSEDLHLMVSSTESYDISYRSSTDFSPSSRRGDMISSKPKGLFKPNHKKNNHKINKDGNPNGYFFMR